MSHLKVTRPCNIWRRDLICNKDFAVYYWHFKSSMKAHNLLHGECARPCLNNGFLKQALRLQTSFSSPSVKFTLATSKKWEEPAVPMTNRGSSGAQNVSREIPWKSIKAKFKLKFLLQYEEVVTRPLLWRITDCYHCAHRILTARADTLYITCRQKPHTRTTTIVMKWKIQIGFLHRYHSLSLMWMKKASNTNTVTITEKEKLLGLPYFKRNILAKRGCRKPPSINNWRSSSHWDVFPHQWLQKIQELFHVCSHHP